MKISWILLRAVHRYFIPEHEERINQRKTRMKTSLGQNGQWPFHRVILFRRFERSQGVVCPVGREKKDVQRKRLAAWHEPLIVNQASSSLSLSFSLSGQAWFAPPRFETRALSGLVPVSPLGRVCSSLRFLISRTIVLRCLCAHAYMNIKVGVWRVARWAYWNLSH